MVTDIQPGSEYGVYTIRAGELVELATTCKDGLGVTITTLVAEGEFRDGRDRQRPLGIRNRVLGQWVISPFAPGARD